MLTTLIAAGAALVLAVAVVSVIWVRHYLDATGSLTARLSVHYRSEFRHCLDAHVDRATCATEVAHDCRTDHAWRTDPHRVADIARACRFS